MSIENETVKANREMVRKGIERFKELQKK